MMNPEQTAEKIANKLFAGCSIECKLDPNFNEREWIAAQIEEAEREAIIRAFEGEDCVTAQIEREAFNKGFRTAKEKAKGIAKEHREWHMGCRCSKLLTERIEEMEP